MNAPHPHFLLFSESSHDLPHGQWRFVLQSLDGAEQVEAADAEPDVHGERLELLAVVRGLEALPRPARVTLVTPSRYVNRGLAYGLQEWRTNGWQWEHFGQMVPVKNRDLWQRVDRALNFHELDCRTWRFDLPHRGAAAAEAVSTSPQRPHAAPPKGRCRRKRLLRHTIVAQRWAIEKARAWRLWAGQLGTRALPLPWLE